MIYNSILLSGIILGFSVSMPVGPLGVLCINRTLNKGFFNGIATGLGAAKINAFYGFITGYSALGVSEIIQKYQFVLQSSGFCFLVYLGVKIMLKPIAIVQVKNSSHGLFLDYLTACALLLSNPASVLYFLSVSTGLGLSISGVESATTLQFVLGIFIGSAIWYAVLNGTVHKTKQLLSEKALKIVNMISGLMILAISVFILFGLLTGEFK